ncbi:MAG: 4a-hydroxytetrahydrobiopterin dehydratase [Pseudomonadota bacterium]
MTTKLSAEERAAGLAELGGSGWVETPGRDAVTKEFRFNNFVEAFGWMSRAAIHAEKLGHHPEWTNVYNRVSVTLTTHDVGGLSALDLELARRLDALSA